MDLIDCFRKGHIRKVGKNISLASSLREMSDVKEKTVKKARVNEENVSAYVSMAYDSLREILDSVCVLNGFKVLSHVCIGKLLKDILEDFDYDGFDRMRWVRNSINYYGEKVELKQGKEIIRKMFEMKKKIVIDYLKK